MTIEFDHAKEGKIRIRQVLDGKRITLGYMEPVEEGHQLSLGKNVNLANEAIDVIETQFIAYLERQALKEETTETDEPVTIYRPAPCPEQGTAGLEFMEWAGGHMAEAEFRELYDYRWSQPKFRTYAAPAAQFCQRAAELFTAE